MAELQNYEFIVAVEQYEVPGKDVRIGQKTYMKPLVRCKDCKWWFDSPTNDGFNSCELDALIRHANFFCAAGERKEDNG